MVSMQSKVGEIYEGSVTGLTGFGAFIKMSNGESGMVHISEVASTYVKDIKDFLAEGQSVTVKVLAINDNKISLSIKQAAAPKQEVDNGYKKKTPPPVFSGEKTQKNKNQSGSMSFEDMMAKFKADSEEKMSALKRSTDMGQSRRRGNK